MDDINKATVEQLSDSFNVPNAETLAAIDEVQKMKADSGIGKSYSDVSQMMEDI